MPGIFAPTPDSKVYARSPIAPVDTRIDEGVSPLEIGLDIAGNMLGMAGKAQRSTSSRGGAGKPDPNLGLFSEEMDKVSQIRASQGEMAGRLAERSVASNFAAAGIDLDSSYKAVYETKTGRSFDAYGRDDEAFFFETQLKDPAVQTNIVASYAMLSPDTSFEERTQWALNEKSKLEAASVVIDRAKTDATFSWQEAEPKYNERLDNFLSIGMGGLIEKEQKGLPVTAQDIAQFKLNFGVLKAGKLSIPSYLEEDQTKGFEERLKQVDNMISTLEKAASNETVLASMTKYLVETIKKSPELTEQQKAITSIAVMKGDPTVIQQMLGERVGDIAKALGNAKVTSLPSTKLFGGALFNPNQPPPTANSTISKEDLDPEILNKYDSMTAQERVQQLKADKTWASLFTSKNMASAENREAFAERAMSLGTTLISGKTDEFLSANFLRDGIASPKMINTIKALDEQDPELGMQTRAFVKSGLNTEKLRQTENLNALDRDITGARFNQQTGKYELNIGNYTGEKRQRDLAAFNAELKVFYNGDLQAAARDDFRRIMLKQAGTLSSVQASNIVNLGNLRVLSSALKRRDAITVIDQGLDQLTDPTEDILAPITEPSGERVQEPVMGQGVTPPAPETTSGITESLLDTLVKIESSGNPNAVSNRKATGLYQIRPSTAADPGFNVTPLSTGSDVASASPEEQRRFARDYLKAMSDRYNGDMALALAAYNGGYGPVDDFVANGTALPKETFDYVQKFVDQGALPQNNTVSSGRPKLDIPADGNVNANQSSMLGDVSGFVTSILGALVDAGIPKAQAEEALSKVPMPPVRPEEAGGTAPMSPSQRRIAAAQARQQARAEEYEEMNSTPLTIVPAMGRAVIGDILRNQLGISQEDITRTEDYFSPEELGVIRGLVEKGLKEIKLKAPYPTKTIQIKKKI